MNRRGFLGAILAAAVAPAIVRADSLMRIVPRELLVDDGTIIEPLCYGNQVLRGEIGRYEGVTFFIDQRGPSRLLARLTRKQRAEVDRMLQQKFDDMMFAGLRA